MRSIMYVGQHPVSRMCLSLCALWLLILLIAGEVADATPVFQWNTFLGSGSDDQGEGIIVDSTGRLYITGDSGATWGIPRNAHAGYKDAFVAQLNGSGNVFISGTSTATWDRR